MKTALIRNKNDLEKSKEAEVLLIDADEKTSRSILESLKGKKISKKILILGRDDHFNRRMIETAKFFCLLSPERDSVFKRKDSLKQRDSGLNHVVAKEAKKKNIAIGIDFQEIKNLHGKAQALRIARIMQNIIICRKAKCLILLLDLKNSAKKHELLAFAFSLGMSSQQAKAAVE
jgi:RNase P/RNase MRP subunit p30